MEENGYKMIKVKHQQQIDYMINFLNIGNNTIISVNKELENISKESGVNSIFIEFKPILNMYGAMHCITQVSRSDNIIFILKKNNIFSKIIYFMIAKIIIIAFFFIYKKDNNIKKKDEKLIKKENKKEEQGQELEDKKD